ncbi:hypothetical protein F4604DRAFT_2003246 [Suillus subluteus]|nr:hypothetical protein F4604DRAFT_2003246 [Suillus subluteus]
MPPPKAKTIQKATTPPTRSLSRLEVNEIITTDSEVTDAVSAKEYLIQTAMAISSKPFSTDNLSDTLFHITQMPGVTAPVQTAIRAVAFLLEEAAEVETADKVAKLVITAISSHIAKIQDASESITEATTQLNSTQEKISNTSVNIVETLETITTTTTQLNTAQEKIMELTSSLNSHNTETTTGSVTIDSRLEKVQEVVITLTTQVKEASQQGGYKAALLKGLDNDNPDSPTTRRAARNTIKKCQVLIDIPKDSHLAPGKVSHEQLVKKIQEALKTINKDDSPNLDIRSVSQFRNGGTIIEMKTQEAAEYLKNKDNKNEFINALDPNATIKERSYPVVIQFVPLTFNPDSAEHLQDLEQEN